MQAYANELDNGIRYFTGACWSASRSVMIPVSWPRPVTRRRWGHCGTMAKHP